MKKILSIVLALMLVLGCVFALTACKEELTEMEETIKAAEAMSWDELVAAAKAENEAEGAVPFKYASLSSGTQKALEKLKTTYSWLNFESKAYGPSKDLQLYNALDIALSGDNYYSDFVMIQDGVSLKTTMLDTGYLLPYNPTGTGITVANEDRDPLAPIYYNKTFMWKKTATYGENYLTNIWQLSGLDGTTKTKVKGISFQNPNGESINMNFLISFLSDSACAELATAYQSYFGEAYTAKAGYSSIGYYFIDRFIKSVTSWHDSDTDAVRDALSKDTSGTVFFAGINKLKNYPKGSYVDYAAAVAAEVMATGLNKDIEGTDGFVYKMWTLIPKTSKMPYTACLLIRYMLTQEAFDAGWADPGYYSSNTSISSNPLNVSWDVTITHLKSKCLVENSAFIASVYSNASMFVRVKIGS